MEYEGGINKPLVFQSIKKFLENFQSLDLKDEKTNKESSQISFNLIKKGNNSIGEILKKNQIWSLNMMMNW